MLPLILLLHIFIGATLAGVAIVVVLVMGWGGLWPILGAAGAGFLVAFPVAWLVARNLRGDG